MNRDGRIKTINQHMSHGKAIVDANHRSGLRDLPLACALVEQESGGRNIFGCDYGPQSGHPPFCEDHVTEARVHALLAQSKNNGVGLTQLTDRGLVQKAMALGGAWKPINQCLVGFKYLKDLVDSYGHGGIWHYNGSPAYQAEIEAKERTWQQRLT